MKRGEGSGRKDKGRESYYFMHSSKRVPNPIGQKRNTNADEKEHVRLSAR